MTTQESAPANELESLKASQLVDLEKAGLEPIGNIPVKRTREIAGSRIGIGFETLDRFMFNPEKVYPHLEELGAKWARVQTGWSRCETQKGVYDFAWLDKIVDRLISIGVQPFFSVSFGNKLYMPDAPHESAVGCVPLYYGEEVRAAWQKYVRALARHFKGRITFWEIWNEPNIPQFWRPKAPDGGDYAELVRLTSLPIRGEIADAQIVGGAMSCLNPSFLEKALQNGMAEWIDIFSFHPYQSVPEYNLQNMYDVIRRLLDRYAGGKPIRIWQGENGCPSQTEGHNDDWFGVYDMDEVVQAKWVARRILVDLKVGFDRALYFHATDLMEQPYRQSGGEVKKPVMMGLIHGKVYRPKYSFEVLRRICSLFDDETERQELFYKISELDPRAPQQSSLMSSPYCASFVRHGAPLFAYWLAEDPQKKTPSRQIDLTVWWDSDLRLDAPILLDLMTGGVYDVSRQGRPFVWDGAVIGQQFRLPLADYPFVLTDRAVLDGQPSPK